MKYYVLPLALGALACAAAAQQSSTSTESRQERSVTIVRSTGGKNAMYGTIATAAPTSIELISPLGGLDGNVVKDAPFSADAVTESVQTLADGNRIVHQSTSKMYRDADGRTRREQTLSTLGAWSGAGDAPTLVFLRDPTTNESYTLSPKDRTAQKAKVLTWVSEDGTKHFQAQTGAVFFSGNAAKGQTQTITQDVKVVTNSSGPGVVTAVATTRSADAEGASNTEDLGDQEVEGVKAHGTRTTVTIPAGKIGNDRDINIVDEQWYSDELQMLVMSKHSDPRSGETTYKLTRIDRNNPDRSLFQVPSDYTVVESKDTGSMIRIFRDKDEATSKQ